MLNLLSLGTILSLKRNCKQILEGKQRVLWNFESGLLDIEREPDKENDIYEESDDRDGEESNTGRRPGKENDIYEESDDRDGEESNIGWRPDEENDIYEESDDRDDGESNTI